MAGSNFFASPPLRARLAARDWILAGLFFLTGIWLYTRHNDFPSFYHPDEPSKAGQVIKNEFNFNHPMLLLQTTRLISWIRDSPRTQQPVTRDGRTASALFAAGAVACLVLLAAHLRSTLAGAAAGLLVLANSQFFELAHYMKEDPALAFGIAAFFLTLVRCWLEPSTVRFVWLGVACALAVSGKYIGIVVLPLALLPVFFAARAKIFPVAGLVLGFLIVFAMLNYPMLGSWGSLRTNVGEEIEYVVKGHKGQTRSVPHGVYGKVFREATNPAIWVLLVVYYGGLIVRRRRVHPAEWTLALFPIAFVLMLSFSPKTHYRYFLPDTLLFCTLAALAVFPLTLPAGLPKSVRGLSSPIFQAALGLVFLAALIKSGWQVGKTDAAFQNDARRNLVDFVRENIPADATIAQDKRVNLPNRNDPRHADSPYFLEQNILGKLFAADVGTMDELRARGIEYVAVSEGDYGRFFLTTHKPRGGDQDDFGRRRAFYEQLFAEGRVVWECPAGDLQYLQPAIKVYQLPAQPAAP